MLRTGVLIVCLTFVAGVGHACECVLQKAGGSKQISLESSGVYRVESRAVGSFKQGRAQRSSGQFLGRIQGGRMESSTGRFLGKVDSKGVVYTSSGQVQFRISSSVVKNLSGSVVYRVSGYDRDCVNAIAAYLVFMK